MIKKDAQVSISKSQKSTQVTVNNINFIKKIIWSNNLQDQQPSAT